jgi:WD40 repeat protein/serine/threonine protein kinase
MNEREIFIQALQIANPGEQAAFLDRACGPDQPLRQQVADLLAAHSRAQSFLEVPPSAIAREPGPTTAGTASERPGTQIGPFKLLQVIGEGGMGVVYMAEQTEPVERRVALKIIKPGMDSRQVIARFEAERQALAMMDHVNIARVFDGGTTENGRPYFVMELVHGVPITKYCDDNHLTPRQRLELFVPVCQAIQHAHQKGIIHRDIKPSNVMVTLYDGQPVPKVIDFGVAKATEQKLTERTLFTQYGTMVGTLEYMSPEQAEMSALGVDTRSDIFSLGVLLYELLTGSTPLSHQRVKEAAYAEILRLIKEEEPPKPSTRLSDSGEALASISANRHTEPAKLTKLVKGELDWIVMKCLEKDRNRRYETANGFAADVQRYLNDEQVLACPPSVGYRLAKFMRRNKGPVLAASVILLLLIGGIVGTTLGLLQAQRSEAHAQGEAIKAGQERDEASLARLAEKAQRKLAEDRAKELRQNLYIAEMREAGQAAAQSPFGLGRVIELLSHWQDEPTLRGWEWYYLHALCHQDVLTISVSADPVDSVAWSSDGTRLATMSRETEPKVWDAVTGKQSAILAMPQNRVIFLGAWSPDGTLLATIEAGIWTVIWDAAARKQRLTLQETTSRSIAWAPDGARLASGKADGTVKVWDATTGKTILVLKGHTAPVTALAWSRDGKRLATADTSGMVKIWDVAAGKEELDLGGKSGVRQLSWSPDGSHLASVTLPPDSTLEVWDTATAERRPAFAQRWGPFSSVSWSPDGKRMAIASVSGQVIIADPATGEAMCTLSGHSNFVQSVAWSPNGLRLASASDDGTVKVWDPDQKQVPLPLQGQKGHAWDVAWSPNGKRLASCSFWNVMESKLNIWDATTGNLVVALDLGKTNAITWNPDGARLALAGVYGVKIWDAATGKEYFPLKGYTNQVFSVAWNSDGSRLALGDGHGSVLLWDPATGEEVHQFISNLKKGRNLGRSVSWSPDRTRLASGSSGGQIVIWDTATGKPTCICNGHNLAATSVAWCPAGTRLASACPEDRVVRIWDTATGEEILTLSGHTAGVWSVSWSPDGTRLASMGKDHLLRIWDPATGKELIAFRVAAGMLSSVAWSPDGLRLAVGQMGTTTIYDATNGYRLAGHLASDGKSQSGKANGFLKP